MKVLYVESFYPQLSETYVVCEIKYLLAMGVEIEVWRERESICPFPEQVHTYTGTLKEAIAASKPDLLHFHFLSELLRMKEDVEASGLPVTLRGHSIDHSTEYLDTVIGKPWMKRLWLYPHFAEKYAREKVEALPSCYDPKLYFPGQIKEPDSVVRACAGIQYKNVESFIRIASMVPEKKFRLIFAWNARFPRYKDLIFDLNASLGSPVQILVNLSHAETAVVVGASEISLYTAHPDAHPFGMPMSILESMATGSLAFIRDHKVPEPLRSNALLFESEEGASRALRNTCDWSLSKWKQAHASSLKAVENFSAPLVIPKIYWGWRNILKGGSS